MKISAFLLLSLCAHAAKPQILFDGKTLDQWQGTPGIWSIEDGALTASIEEGENLSKNEFLYWKDEVADFDLKLEYRISGPTSNSGIQIRSKKNPDNHAAGYQADLDAGSVWLGRIYDEHGRGLIGERGTLTKISPAGERHSIPFSSPESLSRFAKTEDWNEYFIRCRGNRIEIHINGIHFTTLEDNQRNQADLAGRLAVQIHSGAGPAKIQFRNIRLTQFEPNPKSPTAAPRPGIVPKDAPNIGFENGNYEGWESTGTVWGKSPVKGDTIAVRERGNTHHQGSFWIGGYEEWESDEKQGTFTINGTSLGSAHDFYQSKAKGSAIPGRSVSAKPSSKQERTSSPSPPPEPTLKLSKTTCSASISSASLQQNERQQVSPFLPSPIHQAPHPKSKFLAGNHPL